MIAIHQYLDDSDTAPPDAVEMFASQWALYCNIIDHDLLHHQRTAAELHRALQARPTGPLRLIDLACGDARTTLRALQGLPISAYRGVDLSCPALEMAATNLTGLAAAGCRLRLEQRDFSSALRDYPASADVIWIGLSLHHLDTDAKRELLRDAVQALDHGGELLLFEPVSPDGEDRRGYLRHFRALEARWSEFLSAEEWQRTLEHVSDNDLSETVASWRQLGLEAGFSSADTIFLTDNRIYGMFRYRKDPPGQ